MIQVDDGLVGNITRYRSVRSEKRVSRGMGASWAEPSEDSCNPYSLAALTKLG